MRLMLVFQELDIHGNPLPGHHETAVTNPLHILIHGNTPRSRRDSINLHGFPSFLVTADTVNTRRKYYTFTADPPRIEWNYPEHPDSISFTLQPGQTVTFIRTDMVQAGTERQRAGLRVRRSLQPELDLRE